MRYPAPYRPTLWLLIALLALPACARLFPRPVPAVAAAPSAAVPDSPRPVARPAAGARTAAALDTTTAAERAAAVAAPATGATLGVVTVSLGNPADPGFWLQSPLVREPRPGVVRLDSGATVQVDLRPGSGAAQLSLAAYRALGLGLTDLPRVTVLAR